MKKSQKIKKFQFFPTKIPSSRRFFVLKLEEIRNFKNESCHSTQLAETSRTNTITSSKSRTRRFVRCGDVVIRLSPTRKPFPLSCSFFSPAKWGDVANAFAPSSPISLPLRSSHVKRSSFAFASFRSPLAKIIPCEVKTRQVAREEEAANAHCRQHRVEYPPLPNSPAASDTATQPGIGTLHRGSRFHPNQDESAIRIAANSPAHGRQLFRCHCLPVTGSSGW